MAARAVAHAIDGDLEAFNRLSPAVRNATTDQEKALAINALVASGFEQQQANLRTVGGAWSALQGRMGDFREAVIGAVFEGLKLGNTFNDAQAKVGAFLKSDSFNSLTERIRGGEGGKGCACKGCWRRVDWRFRRNNEGNRTSDFRGIIRRGRRGSRKDRQRLGRKQDEDG